MTAERVKRVATGYTNAKGNAVEGFGGGFQFCRLSAEPLFDADGQIRPDVTFAQLAEFVWFAETGTGYTGKARFAACWACMRAARSTCSTTASSRTSRWPVATC